MTSDQLRNGIAVLVAGVWALVALDAVLTQNFTGLAIVTPVMMLIGGFLFTYRTEKQKIVEEEIHTHHNNDLSGWGGG